ncbi:MAG: hypothetical protein ACI915_000726 [Gammaproteobacteria bacterium]|jgi:hypothetical protein
MGSEQVHEGGCLCGQVRYKTTGEPSITGVCHCRYCQIRAGSAFGVLAYFTEQQITITSGECKEYAFASESDFTWRNRFCPNCGTTVFMRLEVFKDRVGIAGGTFDPPTFWYDLSGEVFTRSKAHFVGDITAKDHSETFFCYAPKTPDDPRLVGEK